MAATHEIAVSESVVKCSENTENPTEQPIWRNEEIDAMILNEIREIQRNKKRADTTSVCQEVLKKHGLSKSTNAVQLGCTFGAEILRKVLFRINGDQLLSNVNDKVNTARNLP